jgi:hypothetical protein
MSQKKAAQAHQRDARKTIRNLKAEVRSIDQDMAETTSLLVLSKKLEYCTARTQTASTAKATDRTYKTLG